jgi:hypothetical protein
VASNVQRQLTQPSFDDPKSPQDVYLACLTKVDQNPVDNSWYLLFDMIPVEYALLALKKPPRRWPLLPTILLHVTGSADSVVRATLKVGADGPIEGSWYSLFLVEGGDPRQVLVGELYPPADEFAAGKVDAWTPRYGYWQIADWNLLWIPAMQGPDVVLVRPAAQKAPGTLKANGGGAGVKTRSFTAMNGLPLGGKATWPPTKRLKLAPAVTVPPPVLPPPSSGALGVMNVGQGGCNLVFNRAMEPTLYYDTGYPLGFFRKTLPANMRADLATFTGPIYNNAAGNLLIILSHWDWDHWRLGAVPAFGGNTLAARDWLYPTQPMSPTAQNFINYQIAGAKAQVPAGTPPQVLNYGAGTPNAFSCTLYKYVPPGGAFGGILINNSGLALRVPVDVAVGAASQFLLTGDGNFGYLPLIARAGLTGIGAVHHGSIAHGASANLPAIPGGLASGYIAYSYGINPTTGNHAYGFPVAGAVANYQGAAWTAPTETGTAEGAAFNAGANPGNVRLGNQAALGGAYAATAFAAIGHGLA